MRLTSSFAIFRLDPGEKSLAKARWYGREEKLGAAAAEYRAALAKNPDLYPGWVELFELLRRHGRLTEALGVADQAQAHWGPDAAMPHALRGAALAELGRTAEAITALEAALERDGNLALAWHELGYAASMRGEPARALLALDRAFALEPHTDTLMLRGKILRGMGQYDAAEVAFQGALQASEHDIPRRDAAREIASTRRAASVGRGKPRDFAPRTRAFVERGSLVLDAHAGSAPPPASDDELSELLARCAAAYTGLVRALRWEPAAVAGIEDEDGLLAEVVAPAVGAQLVAAAALDPADRPLLVTVVNRGSEEWSKQLARLERWQCGLTFALTERPDVGEVADVVGTLRGPADASAAHAAAERALGLGTVSAPLDEEILALARNPEAPWQRRCARRPYP